MGEPNSSQQQNHLRNAEDEACARELLVLGSNHATKRKGNVTRTRTSATAVANVKKDEFILLASNNEHASAEEVTLIASNGHHHLHDNENDENDETNDEEAAFTFISDSDGGILVEPTLNSAILTGVGGSPSVDQCDKGPQRIIMHVPNTNVNHSSVASSISDFKFAHALDGNLTDAENSDEEHDDSVEKQPQSSSSVVVPRNSSQSDADDDANQNSASNAIPSNSIIEKGIEIEVDPNEPIDYSKKSNSSFNSSSSSLGGTLVAGAASSSPHPMPIPQPISTNAKIGSTSSETSIGGNSSKKGFSFLSVENLISKSPPRHQTHTTVVAASAVASNVAPSSTSRLEGSMLVPYHPQEEKESCDDPVTTPIDKNDPDKGQQGFQQETTSDNESSTGPLQGVLQEKRQKEDDADKLPQVSIQPQPPSPPAPKEVPESSNMASLSTEPQSCLAKQIFRDTSENEKSSVQNADELGSARISTEAVVVIKPVSTQKADKEVEDDGKALDDAVKTEAKVLVESSETALEKIETTSTLTDQEADTTVQALKLPVSKTETQSLEVEASLQLVKPAETKAKSVVLSIDTDAILLATSDPEVKPAEIKDPSLETMNPKARPIIDTSDSVVVQSAGFEAPFVDEPVTSKASPAIKTSDLVVVQSAEMEAKSVLETVDLVAKSADTVATMMTKAVPCIEKSDSEVVKAQSVVEIVTKASSRLEKTEEAEVLSAVETTEEATETQSAAFETMATDSSDVAVLKPAETAAQPAVETSEPVIEDLAETIAQPAIEASDPVAVEHPEGTEAQAAFETSNPVMEDPAETEAQSTVETLDPVVKEPAETEAQSVSPVIETSDDQPVEQPAETRSVTETSPVLEASKLIVKAAEVQLVVEATNTEARPAGIESTELAVHPVETEPEASESSIETTETPPTSETDAKMAIKASESLVEFSEKDGNLGVEATETADESKEDELIVEQEIVEAKAATMPDSKPGSEIVPPVDRSKPSEPPTINSVSEIKTALMLDPKPESERLGSPSSEVPITAVKTAMPLLTEPSEESELLSEPVITSSVKISNTTSSEVPSAAGKYEQHRF